MIEYMEMGLGQIRCGLNTNTSQTTTYGLALREDMKTKKLLGCFIGR